MTGRNVISIDLDSTLTNGELHWVERPTVNKNMARLVRKLYYTPGFVIIIWSARLWHDASKTVAWLIENDIPFHGIFMQKGATDCYVDDKNQPATEETLKNIIEGKQEFKTW